MHLVDDALSRCGTGRNNDIPSSPEGTDRGDLVRIKFGNFSCVFQSLNDRVR